MAETEIQGLETDQARREACGARPFANLATGELSHPAPVFHGDPLLLG